ncbi:beta-ketoacyl-ACP synthase [Limnofasciculus baicalensis]|uniref:Beta-ketoacyl-ACP synthase n=1 Tax=Limnofasciculus baicalensis BBK-W-15 TaxID=2699891 RepID=A0AAE3GSH6_9CYAN|nr:beta-ketoacyl-ACP synthase [Limnofasciculus baicalensis]MCP2729459.1 beta-ketoacyl-ACP synthase [Limnofasciculus baicalensis BBK-W-15]
MIDDRVDVVVTGIGLISALGNLESSWRSLLKNESGIGQYQPFADLPSLPLGMINRVPTDLESLTHLVVADAIEDANLEIPIADCGVVIGSSRGCQASWEKLARRLIAEKQQINSPFPNTASAGLLPMLEDWLEMLPHQAAIATVRQIGSTGVVLAPMAACATGIWALARGFELIQNGECQQVIAGAVEAPITPLTLAGFDKMGALAKTGLYPFDRQREGLVLGEGAAVLVLESAELAKSRGVPIYGRVLGFGLTCDAYHISTPQSSGSSGILAIKQCLERSKLSPSDIDYIHAHGTGTRLNDQNEAQIIQHLFSHGVAVSSTKGGTAHTLGASGAIGAAFCLMALKHQILPPCVGLSQPEFDLDFVRNPRQCQVRGVLCFSFGFGGQNAVMALGKGELG